MNKEDYKKAVQEVLDKCDTALNMTDPDFIENFKKAIDLKPGEAIQVSTPRLERTDGKEIGYIPQGATEFYQLGKLGKNLLEYLGCGVWDSQGRRIQWLYPAEWYGAIPQGHEIVTLSGRIETFELGKTSDDRRFGLLAYGFYTYHLRVT